MALSGPELTFGIALDDLTYTVRNDGTRRLDNIRITTDNPLRGATVNPWAPGLTAGGSSGGSSGGSPGKPPPLPNIMITML